MAKRNSLNLPMSTTHAGGIQPSASFFRPSKPSQYSPPATPDIPLNPLQHDEGSVHDSEPDTQFVTLKTIRRSREPLLPGTGPHSASSRNSMSRDPPLSPTKLVRNSVDRMLTISRGLSFDSVTKSGLRGSKLGDEESQQHHRKRYHSSRRDSQRDSGRSSFSLAPPSVASLSASSPSPDPHPLSFVSTPPPHDPPLSAVPLINNLNNRPFRRWELHPSRNRFFLNGRILTGGDSPWAFIASFVLLLSIAGCWFATAGVWWWRNMSPAVTIVAAYLTLLTISAMLTTVTTDPGILPRNLDPDPPFSAASPSDETGPIPMPRDLKVRSDVVRVKYCPTCRIYRPPRSSHCKMCDNCVDGCDHHCQWVNNCIGRRNYSIFFVLLMSATITVIYMSITSALHIYFYNGQVQHSFRKTLSSPMGIGSALAFALSVIVIWPIVALLSYHVRLLFLNVTTIEQIRNQAHKSVESDDPPPPNPFSHGSWRRNVVATLCRPTGLSWLNGRGLVTEDRREVNPAFLHSDEGVEGEGRTEPIP